MDDIFTGTLPSNLGEGLEISGILSCQGRAAQRRGHHHKISASLFPPWHPPGIRPLALSSY